MTYEITVPEMHCKGCEGLMRVTLEDYFQNINPDHEIKKVKFESRMDNETVEIVLKKLFEDLKNSDVNYSFINLKALIKYGNTGKNF